MIDLIEPQMNGELQASLNTILEQLTVLPQVAQTSQLQEMLKPKEAKKSTNKAINWSSRSNSD